MTLLNLVSTLGLLLTLFLPVTGQSAPPAEGLPKGSIIAFLPDPQSKDYSDDASLRRWLASHGWAICDGTRGTPNLNFRLLIGSTRMETTGQSVGTRTHRHRVQGKTNGTQTRQQTVRQGVAPLIRVPAGRHRHELTATTEPAEHLPPSTRVIFIMKIH